jgi:PKD repeat protein
MGLWHFDTSVNGFVPDASGNGRSGKLYNVILVPSDNPTKGINTPPIVDFTVSPQSGTAPLVVEFTNSSFDPNGYPVSFNWDFGDGFTSVEQNPKHTFNFSTDLLTSETFLVTLKVTEADGVGGPVSNTLTKEIEISAIPTAATIGRLTFSLVKTSTKLRWESLSELSVLGFNVYRSVKNPTGFSEFAKLNKEVISAKNIGNIVGAKYSFIDSFSKSGKTYRYKVEVIGANTKTLEWSNIVRVVVP